MRAALLATSLAIAALSCARPVLAGGYDTPMLYSARHMGMGGVAIGGVRDPSALFHNPAGLAHVDRVSVLGDFSLLVGDLQGSPSVTARNTTSDTTVAPFFLVGSGVRLTDFLVLGLGLYPVASSGATYRYGDDFEDTTTLLFIEASPALAINLPENVRLGVGYRVTFVRLIRYQGSPDGPNPPFIDLTLSGHDYAGLRAGIQWTPTPELDLGFTYRHITETEVSADGGIALGQRARDLSTSFTLPSRFGVGARFDWSRVAGFPLVTGADVEYALQSQNEGDPLEGVQSSTGARLQVPNVFEWSDAVTLRLGVEYPFLLDRARPERRILGRLGYVYDAQTANEVYPTAFGTPPGPTQVLTTGVGYDDGSVQVNLAYAYRFGSAEVTRENLSGPSRKNCAFCGADGDYEIALNGFYVDVSYDY